MSRISQYWLFIITMYWFITGVDQSILVIYYYYVLVHYMSRISQHWLFIITMYWFISGVESVNIGYLLLPCTGSFQE